MEQILKLHDNIYAASLTSSSFPYDFSSLSLKWLNDKVFIINFIIHICHDVPLLEDSSTLTNCYLFLRLSSKETNI